MPRNADAAAQRAALIEAVDAEVMRRRIPHRQVARECGIGPSSLYRFMHGQEVHAGVVFGLFAWLDSDRSEVLNA
jgi:predicted DNA-binding transcriptional regulator AlpA